MKKWLIFGGGFLTGVIVTFLILVAIGLAKQSSDGLIGATMFDKPGQVIEDRGFKVMQVIENNAALAHAWSRTSFSGEDYFHGTLYVIFNTDGKYYYDDEIIWVPRNKEVRQVGIYKYTTKSGDYKTVPVIKIMD